MKKTLLALGLLSFNTLPANADVYVIVDSNNIVISGAIVCEASVCGNPNSLYSKLTLKEGQRYVLQAKRDANGNDAGIGAQPNQVIAVKEQPTQNTFVVVTPTQVTTITTPTVVQPQPVSTPVSEPVSTPAPQPTAISTPEPVVTVTPVALETSTSTVESPTVITSVETATVVTSPIIETSPSPEPQPVSELDLLAQWIQRWTDIWAEFLAWLKL